MELEEEIKLKAMLGGIECRLDDIDAQLKEIKTLVWMIAEILKTLKTR
ncbi:MAG: hypothetical protein QXP96_04915 [Thermoproteota archaeon]